MKDDAFVVTNTIPVQAFCQPRVKIACSLYANPGKEPFYETYGFQPLPNAQYGHGMLLELS